MSPIEEENITLSETTHRSLLYLLYLCDNFTSGQKIIKNHNKINQKGPADAVTDSSQGAQWCEGCGGNNELFEELENSIDECIVSIVII